jgi:cellulose synthase/poly-beta-1,6-N-acetylglucosamine synthase-like glycosyltransferase
MFSSIIHIIFSILFAYLAFTTIYFFIVGIAGKLKRANSYSSVAEKRKIVLFIPSYKEDNIIVDTASKAIQQNYPKNKFDVFVIADKLQKSTIDKLKSLQLNVVEVKFQISMKAKSIHEAVNQASAGGYDIAMILDADNIMSENCLEKVNHAFNKGFRAVQCHRVAKNKNNSVAVLDVISEEINNNLFRRGQRALGFSSSLIGSGMAFEFETFKNIFNQPQILDNPGEDREIDLQLMKDDIVVEFIDDAYVFDEKVSSSAVFEKQRLRWLEAQLNNLKRFFDKDIRAFSGKRVYWYKLFQTLLLPRSLYLLIFAFIFLVLLIQHFLSFQIIFPSFYWWCSVFSLYILTLMVSIPIDLYNKNMVKAIAHLPVLMVAMLKAILKIKSNRKEFLHTPKMHVSDQ